MLRGKLQARLAFASRRLLGSRQALMISLLSLSALILYRIWADYQSDCFQINYHWNILQTLDYKNAISCQIYFDNHACNCYYSSPNLTHLVLPPTGPCPDVFGWGKNSDGWSFHLWRVGLSKTTGDLYDPASGKYSTVYEAVLPYPLLFALALIHPLAWHFIRVRTIPLGYCQHCAYDLRASVGRCPECGSRVPVSLSNTKDHDLDPALVQLVPRRTKLGGSRLGLRLTVIIIALKLSLDATMRNVFEPRRVCLELPQPVSLLLSLPLTYPFTDRPEFDSSVSNKPSPHEPTSPFSGTPKRQMFGMILFIIGVTLNSAFWGYLIAWFLRTAKRPFQLAWAGSERGSLLD
jgi:hypothetical protein